MSGRRQHITVGDISVEVIRKRIKNVNLAVYPPDGRVRVSVPHSLPDPDVRRVVVGKIGWIRRKQAKFRAQVQPQRPKFVTGEIHYYLGQPYRLEVVEVLARPSIRLNGSAALVMSVRPETDPARRQWLLQEWYRKRLNERLPGLLERWEPVVGVDVAECRIKRMKTRWGTCNTRAHRIWLNLELAKRPPQCLEYVLVHEMAHLHERHHNDRFWALMDTFMPDWRLHRDELNRQPVVHSGP